MCPNILKVVPHPIDLKFPSRVRCQACGEPFHLHTGYADLNGKPFEGYYCAPCGGGMAYVQNRKEAQ